MGDKELMVVSTGEHFKIDEIDPISVANETKVLQNIIQVCSHHLKGFEHSLDHDNKLLESGELKMYSNERNAVVMRRGEKKVYHWYMDLATKALKVFKMPWKEQKKFSLDKKKKSIRKKQGSQELIDEYLGSVIVKLCQNQSR